MRQQKTTFVLAITQNSKGGERLSDDAYRRAEERGARLYDYFGVTGSCVMVFDGSAGSDDTARGIARGIVTQSRPGTLMHNVTGFIDGKLNLKQLLVNAVDMNIVVVVRDAATFIAILHQLLDIDPDAREQQPVAPTTESQIENSCHAIITIENGRVVKTGLHSCP